MRYTASEKLEIIRLVEQSHLSVRRTLKQIGIPRATFYRWYDLYQTGGPDALEDRSPRPDRVWNRGILYSKDIVEFTVIAFRPDMAAGRRVDELGVDPHLVTNATYTAFEHVAHAQLLGHGSADVMYDRDSQTLRRDEEQLRNAAALRSQE